MFGPEGSLLFSRGVRRGLLTLRRQGGWGTSLGVMLGILLLTQLFVVSAFGAQGMHRLIRAQTDLRLQIDDGASDREIQEFLIAAREHPTVQSVQYVTREQAYERERERNAQLIAFLEEFSVQNPFPDTVAVTLRSLRDYDAFAGFTREERWKSVVDPRFLTDVTNQEREVHELLRLTATARTLTLGFLALAGGVLLFVLTDLVRHRSLERSDEIFVERLFGARASSVLLPFATEATVLLGAAVLGSLLLLWLLIMLLPVFVPAILDGGSIAPLRQELATLFRAYAPFVVALEAFLIPVLAIGGAALGMRKATMVLGV